MQHSENVVLPNLPRGLQAAGALLRYLHMTQPTVTHSHLQQPRSRPLDQEMQLDNVTIRNLELLKPLSDNRGGPTLLTVLDNTLTAMGARLLRHWIVRPLIGTQ